MVLKMSVDSEKSCVFLSPPDSRTSCVWEAADEKEEDPDVGEESVLEMLTYSKFSDLETWLCLPSSQLLSKTLDSASNSSTSSSSCSSSSSSFAQSDLSFCTVPRETVPELRSSEKDSCLLPPFTSTPKSESVVDSARSAIRKRRRLAGGPGGLHWDTKGSLQRDFQSPVPSQVTNKASAGAVVRPLPLALRGGASWASQRATLRKTVSVDERLLQVVEGQDDLRLLSRLEGDRKKLCGVQGLSTSRRHDSKKKSEGPVCRSAQKWNQRPAGDDLKPLFDPRTRCLLPVLTRHMHNLQLSQNKKWPGSPASPSAAKRLYRNLSEKLRGSSTSIEDASFSGRMDHLHKASSMQCSGCLLEAVEQQDLDSVQILLLQFSGDELDLNTPNSPMGLIPLDIAVMTNNMPIARLLLRAGAKESPQFVDVASRDAHLSALVLEAEQRVADLVAAAQRDGLSLDECQKDQQLRAWEWKSKLYRCMRAGLQHARAPEAPSMVRLTVSSSNTLSVTFQEPQGLNATVVTKYRVEWSCLKDFSLLAGEMVLDNLQTLKCIISNLTTGRLYYVRVSAYNMKGWGPATPSLPLSAAPSSWRDGGGRDSRSRGYIEAMERLLQQVRATHTHDCCGDAVKIQNASRKQSVSRSLKLLFNSSNKFIKVLKRGLYLAAVLYHQERVLVSAEDQIPIVEVDDSFSNTLMQDFLWFTKLSCMWDDVRWLRQTSSMSMMSSSSTLQLRHKMLTATHQLQNLLGTQNLGRVHYEPIKDHHGNVLLVTVRNIETQNSVLNGKWIQVSKLQSQRKSLSTPEEPYALDFLIITIQDILAYQRRSTHRLAPGLYLGYLKLSSSVDQIRILVSLRTPNMLCHARIRDNANVSRDEWDWIQKLSAAGGVGEAGPEGHAPLLFYDLQIAIKSLLKQIHVSVHQARSFRLYSHEVIELGHGVNFLLLLPAADDVCSAPGKSNPYTPLSGFLHLPLQMFELGHFCAYKERFMGLYCRLSSVLDLDAIITQQALREAITDGEVATAKQRHLLILDYIQQLDEMRRDIRWLTDVLQNARKGPHGGVPITFWLEANDPARDSAQQKTDSTSSTSSTMDFLPILSPSPEPHRWNTISDSLLSSDEDISSEVFLPTDSDYDSRDAVSPQESDLLYSASLDLSEQAMHSLGGSAPDVLQIHQLRCSSSPFKDPSLSPVGKDSPFSPQLPHHPAPSKDLPRPLSLSTTLPNPPALSGTTKTLEGLSLSKNYQEGSTATPTNAPAKRKLRSRSHQYFGGPQRWLRGHNGQNLSGSLSEGIYTRQLDPDLPSVQGTSTYVSHTSCILESRRGRHREPRNHVRRIFVEPCKELSPGQERKSWEEVKATRVSMAVESGEEEPDRACTQEVDSDDQTNAQVSEILSSTL